MAKYDKAQVAEYVDDLKTLDGETSWSANSTARPPLPRRWKARPLASLRVPHIPSAEPAAVSPTRVPAPPRATVQELARASLG